MNYDRKTYHKVCASTFNQFS